MIDLSPIVYIYMPEIDRSLSDCRIEEVEKILARDDAYIFSEPVVRSFS